MPSRHIQGVRTIFAHAADRGWILTAPKFGKGFRKLKPPRKKGTPLSTADISALLAASAGMMRAFILLCANAGYTARDCALLPVAAIDRKRMVLVFPRPKMFKREPIERACVLWPETLAALDAIRKDDRLFCGERGAEFRSDVACHQFRELCKTAKVKPPRGPAWIRHWFSTVAGATRDTDAIARIMGHRLPGMREVYVDAVEHDRLAAVSDYVRTVLIHPALAEAPEYEI
jgi:integrase